MTRHRYNELHNQVNPADLYAPADFFVRSKEIFMNSTVFLTVLAGVITYVLGQLILKLLIEPVTELKRTIGEIAHSLIEHANVIQNPGVPKEEMITETSRQLRKLSSQLEAHLYLIPMYRCTSKLFFLPSRDKIIAAARGLMGLSNSVFRAADGIYKQNAHRVENVFDSLGIYMSEGDRWPKEHS